MPSSEFINILDEATRASLLSFRDLWFHRFVCATGVVVAGIVFEGPEVIHEFLGRKKPKWMAHAGLLGWLLIVGGVTGECVFEVFVSRADGQIQTFDNIQLRATEREAVTAFKQATEAFNRATSAEEEAGENKLEAERLRLRAEDEAAKRIAIEQQLAWRTLTSEQRKRLSSPIPSEFVGTTLIVANPMGDAEGWSYAADLWQALSKAGWGDSENPGLKGTGIGNPRPQMFPAAVPQGIEVIERGKSEAGSFLWKTMLDCGIGVTKISIPVSRSAFNLSTGPMSSGLAAILDANIPPNTLELLVGVKPQPTKIVRLKQ
jgi:hypothetical protein